MIVCELLQRVQRGVCGQREIYQMWYGWYSAPLSALDRRRSGSGMRVMAGPMCLGCGAAAAHGSACWRLLGAARTTLSESSNDAMHPVLGSSNRMRALTNLFMLSGLLMSTTPVSTAVVCGAHDFISALDASFPAATEAVEGESRAIWRLFCPAARAAALLLAAARFLGAPAFCHSVGRTGALGARREAARRRVHARTHRMSRMSSWE